jgi:rSAM/selenodomain-associated transferase 2
MIGLYTVAFFLNRYYDDSEAALKPVYLEKAAGSRPESVMNVKESTNSIEISIVMPVFKEAGVINETILDLRRLTDGSKTEVIVVDGDPFGSTVRAINDKQIITAVAEKGRARQMNHGASRASGDVVLFLHADCRLPLQAMSLIRHAMRDEGCVGGAFNIGFDTDRKIFRITEWYVKHRTRFTRVPFGDQAIFVRREYFDRINGYAVIPLMEDVELMRRIRKRGDRICILPEKVYTSVRRWEREGILYCTLRNLILQASYLAGVRPERLVTWYRPSDGGAIDRISRTRR